MSQARARNVQEGPRAAAEKSAARTVQTVGGVTIVPDSRGRKFGLRKLKPSERFSLAEAVEAATMSANMQLITAATVISIDEDALPPIGSRADLLARLDEIGDEGLAAITPEVLKMYGIDLDREAIEAAKN